MTVRDAARIACAVVLLAVLVPDAVVGEASRPRIFDVRSVPPTDTALVFGAGVEPDGSPSAMLGDRLDLAVRLYRAGKVRRILLSADDVAGDREIPAMLARVRAARVPRAFRATACSWTTAGSRRVILARAGIPRSGGARQRS